MEAKIIGPASELGQFDDLDFFGNKLTREFSKIEVTAEELEKLKGNRFVEIKGKASAKPAITTASDDGADDKEEAIRARLAELGVEVPAKASAKNLQAALEKAEAAKAKQDEEEAEILAQAEEIEASREG